jgi:hypothetical protein
VALTIPKSAAQCPFQLCCAWLQAVWAKLGSKRLLWERMQALFYNDALASMWQLLEACLYGLKTSTPRSAPAGAGLWWRSFFALDGVPGTLGSFDVRDRLVQPG